jgi:hypothetical protein
MQTFLPVMFLKQAGQAFRTPWNREGVDEGNSSCQCSEAGSVELAAGRETGTASAHDRSRLHEQDRTGL